MKKLFFAFAMVGFFSFNTAVACGGGSKASANSDKEAVSTTVSQEASSEATRSCAGKAKTAEAKKKDCSSKTSSTAVAQAKSEDE